MIIGNGLIASAFKESQLNHDNYIIFASGVSNSLETDANEFNREYNLLKSTIEKFPNKKLIYFTSVLSQTLSNEYYLHKNKMEKTIKAHCDNYIIYAIPQLIGLKGNKNNLIQTLKSNIIYNKEILIYNGINRAILDVEDLVEFVSYSIDKVCNEKINISYIEKISVLEITKIISSILNKNPSIKVVEGKGENWYLENSTITIEWILFNDIKAKGYTKKILRKYI